MEEAIKQVLPGLAKASPYLIASGIILYYLVKMILSHLTDLADKKAAALKERDDNRDKLFRETISSRELFFTEELDKKDAIIHEKDAEIKSLNLKLVELIKDNIEVTKNNSVLFQHLKELLNMALNK